MTGFFDKLYDIIFPEYDTCIICGDEHGTVEYGLCSECREKLWAWYDVPEKKYRIINVDDFEYGAIYCGAAAYMVKRLKYSKDLAMAKYLTEIMPYNPDWDIDFAVPVPINPLRRLTRGINQCTSICNAYADMHGLSVNHKLLHRVDFARSQVGVSTEKRNERLKDAFVAQDCRGASILLIDDVCTTGTTLQRSAEALLSAGAERVFAVTACKAL